MQVTEKVFDPVHYKTTTREQWQTAAEAWHRWNPTLKTWLGPATDLMLDMAQVKKGYRVLDIAAGAGEQSITAAKKVGPEGYVLATDIAPEILEYALELAKEKGIDNIDVEVVFDPPWRAKISPFRTIHSTRLFPASD